jgi:hypothetical protein
MASLQEIYNVLERVKDYQSARNIFKEVLSEVNLTEKANYSPEELAKLVDSLAKKDKRIESVVESLKLLGGSKAAEKPAEEPPAETAEEEDKKGAKKKKK